MTKSQRRRVASIVRYAVLTVWALFAFFPIYWMVSTSFKPDNQWFSWPPVYFPDPPTLSNYLNVWFGAGEYTQTQYAISSQKPLISMWNSAVIASTSIGSTRKACPPAISWSAEFEDVRTGVPEAIASTIGSPNPS